jgi:hypothetical protein
MCVRKRAIQVVFDADAVGSWEAKRLRATTDMSTRLGNHPFVRNAGGDVDVARRTRIRIMQRLSKEQNMIYKQVEININA